MSIHVPPVWPKETGAFDEVDAIEAKAEPTPDDLGRLDVLAHHPSSLVAMSARQVARAIRSRRATTAIVLPLEVPEVEQQPTDDAGSEGSLEEGYRVAPAVHGATPANAFDPARRRTGIEVSPGEDVAPSALPITTQQTITILASDIARHVMELHTMADGKFVSYLRVSTARQGASGLGLEAQRKAVGDFLDGGRWTHVREFVEIESGKRDDRPKLAEAMALCRLHGAVLVIAKLDRLSRDAHFLLGLQKAGVRFVAADMPEANEMVVGIMAVVAQAERKMISTRTKAALAAAKARGTKLGGDRGNFAMIADQGRAAGRAARQGKAMARAADVRPIITSLRAEGVTSLAQLAAALTERGIPTSRGADRWSPMQVSRVLKAAADGA